MKKIKTILCLLLAMLTLLGSVACGGRVDENDPSTLQVRVLKKGYGSEYVEKLADAYMAKTGKKVSVKSHVLKTKLDNELKAGPSVNDIDLYFLIERLGYILKDGATYAKGWNDLALTDLSDVMDDIPSGYDNNLKVKEMLNEYSYQGTLYNGKSYGVPYAFALEGLVYNVDLMKDFFGNDYHTPRTTDEMFEMFDFIAKGGNEEKEKGNYKTGTYENGDSFSIYPFVYAGKNDYLQYLFLAFWAQYIGQDEYYKMLKGQNASDEYTDEIFASQGRYESMSVIHDMVYVGDLGDVGKPGKRAIYDGYVNKNARDYDFTRAQVGFLEGEAVFMTTGDWIEREMEGNFPETCNIEFMKMPVVSAIIDNLPDKSIKNDEQLQEVVAYVDNGGTTGFESTKYGQTYTNKDVAKILEARLIINCESEDHMMVVPAYSNNIEGAKDFIRFVLSKEGQEIQMKYSHGNSVPYTLNYEQTYSSIFATMSSLSKSKLNIVKNAKLVGKLYNQPITYKGGMTLLGLSNVTLEAAFGNVITDSSYKTAEQMFEMEYNSAQSKFSNWLTNAGLNK